MKTSLQVELQNSPGSDSKRRDVWSLGVSGIREQTDAAQNYYQETRHHGLGPFFLEKRTRHNNSNFAQRDGQRETRRRVANRPPRVRTGGKPVRKTCSVAWSCRVWPGASDLFLCYDYDYWSDLWRETKSRKGMTDNGLRGRASRLIPLSMLSCAGRLR